MKTTMRTRQYKLSDSRLVVLRQADAEDAEELLEILNTAASEKESFTLVTAEDVQRMEMTPAKEREWIKDHHKVGNLLFVAQVDGQMVGTVTVDRGTMKRVGHVGELHIYIRPEFRGIGLGKALMEAAIEWAQNEPVIEKLAMNVMANNTAAIELYKKFGFREEARKIKEIKPGPGYYVDCLRMYRLMDEHISQQGT